MIGITTTEPDNSAVAISAIRIKSAIYHTAIGALLLTHVNDVGATVTKRIDGQQGADLYNALVAIKAGTYTSTT